MLGMIRTLRPASLRGSRSSSPLGGFNTVAVVALFVVVVSITGCKSSGPDFDALRSGWIADLQAKNLDGSLSRYADDAAFFSPDGTHATSSGAIRSLFSQVFSAYDAQITMIPVRIEYSGRSDLAFESGTFAQDLTIRATKAVKHSTGDYLIIYQRAPDGRWIISQQVWTGAPDPPTLPAATQTPIQIPN
jgi:ketosteroid isomerase-like protein